MKQEMNEQTKQPACEEVALRQASFRQLHKIVADEMKKPIASQDTDFITECYIHHEFFHADRRFALKGTGV